VDEVSAALERHYRVGHARILAALTRRFGVRHLPSVENAVQEAYVRALRRWPEHGPPDDPAGWLVRVAHNAVIDELRRERPMEALDSASDVSLDPPASDPDDEVRLMFLCCEPVLSRAAQIALVLNVAFGLSARQIATAFICDERTVAQRIVRAKQRLREEGVRFDLPPGNSRAVRVAAVLDVLYLAFSEGYSPSVGEETFDEGLCREALRFVRSFTDRDTLATPPAFALRALLCFHAARAPARVAGDGGLLLMAEQDRSRWDRELIDEAFDCLANAGRGAELSRYHVEAAIAACHAIAPTYTGTDWQRVAELYDLLRELSPSLVVDVNRAFAVAMRDGATAGLNELDAIPEREAIARYPYAMAAYADLHASLGNLAEACAYLDRAIAHQASPAQAALLRRKRRALERRAT
jgi:RNA polymerase sigma-70 factor (ECF subfamily)